MCLRSANTKYSLQDEMTWKAEKMIEYQCLDINQECRFNLFRIKLTVYANSQLNPRLPNRQT